MRGTMDRKWAVLVACLATACLKPAEVTQCGDFTCGASSICSPDGTRCVAPAIVEACQGKADGDGCSFPGLDVGVCTGQLCVASGCGNGILETDSNEVCDDGNRTAGDGCSPDCTSLEACGDGILDPINLELCDCGNDPQALPLGCTGVNADTPNAQCRTSCVPSRCGDTIVDAPNERCDDGNNLAGDGCAADCTGRWTRMTSNTLAKLADVWATSSTDAWAVGDGRIMRWNGASWYRQTEIDSDVRRYTSVCGRSSQDVFVVAVQVLNQVTQVLRYQGAGSSGTWSIVTPGNSSFTWRSVHCFGNDVWVAGSGTNNGIVGAYAISTAGSVFSTGMAGELGAPLTSIFKSTTGDVYVADENGYVHKQNGVYWPTQTQDGTSGTPAVPGNYLGGTTSDNVFLAGQTKPASRHGTAVGWTQLIGSDDLVPAADVSAIPNGSSALIVGQSGGVLECSATGCTVSPTHTDQQLHGVWAIDPTHAFIVGAHGTILY